MIHKGEQLERKAKEMEQRANSELDEKKRAQMRRLASELRQQKRDWYKPR